MTETPVLTDLGYVRALCARHGFAMAKQFGQNFIINPGICPKMAEAAGLGPGWGALEIGPGIGVLTRELATRAERVVTVELDQRLPPLLAESLAGLDNIRLVMGDALKLDLRALIAQQLGDLRVAVCANLPYYITSPLLMRLLEERLPVESITVMVQKEAAERICAAPGTRAAGAISLAVRYYAAPRVLFSVSPGSFTPPPKVTSAVIQLTPHPLPPCRPHSEKRLFTLVRAAFGQRRKTAVNGISSTLGLDKAAVQRAFDAAGLSPTARPEELTLEDFCALENATVALLPADYNSNQQNC